jgi:D-threonate/D-erythronate kinase
MARVLVVADDLTGANATGARFARVGFSTASVTTPEAVEGVAATHDVVVTSTSSRHVAADEAARRVERAIDTAGAVALVVKRTDTTLRGNVGAELEAALRQVRCAHPRARAIFVPAFPEAGRITVGGLQLVEGVAVARSPAGRDHLTPVTSSRVADVVRQQTDLTVREVHLDVVQDAEEVLAQALMGPTGEDHTQEPADVLVVDTTDRRDLTAIGRAAARCVREHGAHWLVVDPGPFGPELAMSLGLTSMSADVDPLDQATPVDAPPLLVVAGSVTRATREQLVALEHIHDATFLDLDVAAFDELVTAEELVRSLTDVPAGGVVGLRTAAAEDQVVTLERAAAEAIPHRLGAIVRAVLGRVDVGGLYLTGGDVTIGVLEELGGSGIAIDDEVLPLAVTGRVVGGPHAGLRVVTKGGLIGDTMAAVTCMDALRRRSIDDRKATP